MTKSIFKEIFENYCNRRYDLAHPDLKNLTNAELYRKKEILA
jgi:hypothetical protein